MVQKHEYCSLIGKWIYTDSDGKYFSIVRGNKDNVSGVIRCDKLDKLQQWLRGKYPNREVFNIYEIQNDNCGELSDRSILEFMISGGDNLVKLADESWCGNFKINFVKEYLPTYQGGKKLPNGLPRRIYYKGVEVGVDEHGRRINYRSQKKKTV